MNKLTLVFISFIMFLINIPIKLFISLWSLVNTVKMILIYYFYKKNGLIALNYVTLQNNRQENVCRTFVNGRYLPNEELLGFFEVFKFNVIEIIYVINYKRFIKPVRICKEYLKISIDTLNNTSIGTSIDTLNGTLNNTSNGTTIDTLNGTLNNTLKGTSNNTLKGTLNNTLKGTSNNTLKGTINGTSNNTLKGTLNNTSKKIKFDGNYPDILDSDITIDGKIISGLFIDEFVRLYSPLFFDNSLSSEQKLELVNLDHISDEHIIGSGKLTGVNILTGYGEHYKI